MILDRITINSEIAGGKPTIRGMRITVTRVLELVETYPNRDELLQEFPDLEAEDITQAIEYVRVNGLTPTFDLLRAREILDQAIASGKSKESIEGLFMDLGYEDHEIRAIVEV